MTRQRSVVGSPTPRFVLRSCLSPLYHGCSFVLRRYKTQTYRTPAHVCHGKLFYSKKIIRCLSSAHLILVFLACFLFLSGDCSCHCCNYCCHRCSLCASVSLVLAPKRCLKPMPVVHVCITCLLYFHLTKLLSINFGY